MMIFQSRTKITIIDSFINLLFKNCIVYYYSEEINEY
jgi:hypothetical protein